MSPIPRSRTRILSGISSSGSNGRLNLLIVLVVVQIVLLVIILLNQQTETDDSRAVTEMRQLLIDIDQTAARLDAISEQQVINTQNAVIPANVVMSTKPDENMSDEDEIVAIKVQVLNGCGIAGIASKAAKWLQRNGYVVEDIGNADRQDINLTSIVDRSGNLTAARELASLLGISEDQIKRQGSGPKPKVDLTLIIGKDCKRLPIGR